MKRLLLIIGFSASLFAMEEQVITCGICRETISADKQTILTACCLHPFHTECLALAHPALCLYCQKPLRTIDIALHRASYQFDPGERNGISLLEQGSEDGDSGCELALGNYYQKKGKIDESIGVFRRLIAHEGVPDKFLLEAFNNLGIALQKKEEHAEAVQFFRQAAERGNGTAQFNLSICYYHGQGIEKDVAQAKEWCTKASENGNSKAKFYLEDRRIFDE